MRGSLALYRPGPLVLLEAPRPRSRGNPGPPNFTLLESRLSQGVGDPIKIEGLDARVLQLERVGRESGEIRLSSVECGGKIHEARPAPGQLREERWVPVDHVARYSIEVDGHQRNAVTQLQAQRREVMDHEVALAREQVGDRRDLLVPDASPPRERLVCDPAISESRLRLDRDRGAGKVGKTRLRADDRDAHPQGPQK